MSKQYHGHLGPHISQIHALYDNGLSFQEIADRLRDEVGYFSNLAGMVRHVLRAKLPPKKRGLTAAERRARNSVMTDRFVAGESVEALARSYSLTKLTVQQIVKQRKPSGAWLRQAERSVY